VPGAIPDPTPVQFRHHLAVNTVTLYAAARFTVRAHTKVVPMRDAG